jgi:hypothetical protein
MAISAKFEADFSQFTEAVKGAEGSLKALETGAKSVGPAILASLASTELRRFGSDVAQVAKEFIGAFAEEEAATKKLTVALQAQGTFTPELAKQYKDLAAEFQNTTAFSDDMVIGMEALMVQVGGVMPTQMNAALTAATNLSAGLGIDLHAATLAVAKGFEGGSTALLKMVPSLKSVIKEGASMDEVLAIINTRFSGQATAQLETYTGQVAQLNNKMGDFKEKVGELLLTGLTPLMNAFTSMPESMQIVILGTVALVTALTPLALSIGALTPIIMGLVGAIGGAAGLSGALATLVPFIGPAGIIAAGFIAWYQVFKNLDVFIWAAKHTWEMLATSFQTAASAITGAAQAVYEGVKTWLVDRFQVIVDWVQTKIDRIVAAFRAMQQIITGGSIVPDMMGEIAAEFQKLDRIMVQPVIKATQLTVGEFQGMSGPTLSAAAGVTRGSTGGGAGVVNHIYVNGTAEDVARKVSAEIMRTIKSGAKFGT